MKKLTLNEPHPKNLNVQKLRETKKETKRHVERRKSTFHKKRTTEYYNATFIGKIFS